MKNKTEKLNLSGHEGTDLYYLMVRKKATKAYSFIEPMLLMISLMN